MKIVEKPLPLYQEFLGYNCGQYQETRFRRNQEDEFPWNSSGSEVWFAVLTLEFKIIQYYGFSSSKSGRKNLLELLKEVSDTHFLTLIGIWNGEWRTDLFILNKKIAIKKLEEVTK
jgi:hypothetical protein